MPVYLAPAKINLTLEILSRRDDGYHTLRSVMVPIGLYDEVEIEPLGGGANALVAAVEYGDEDLALRAARAAGLTDRPLSLTVRKRIPTGGGLGGGSSDAATVLRAAMSGAFGEPKAGADWLAEARALGSDVPFFLTGTGALVEGTGERVTALGKMPPWWCLVVRPKVAVPTGPAYRLLDDSRERNGTPSRPRAASASLATVDALQRGDFAAVESLLVNDFHAVVAAAYPDVGRAIEDLASAGAARPLLSGSGSCVFALFESEAALRDVAGRFDPESVEGVYACPLHTDANAWR